MDRSDLNKRIHDVVGAHPDLAQSGFRCTPDQAEFDKEREQLFSDRTAQQVERCLDYLVLVRKTRSARPKEGRASLSSYQMKHRVEQWQAKGDDMYIANGAFIVAALVAGVRIYDGDYDRPNCLVEDAQADWNFPRRGNVAAIRQYLSRYGDFVQEAFVEARAEYRRVA